MKLDEKSWNFLRFCLKKNKIISVSVKGNSCNNPEENFIKKRPQHIFVYILQNL